MCTLKEYYFLGISILSIVLNRYSREFIKAIHKFEKVDYKLQKEKLDISFLDAKMKISSQTFSGFFWLIKTFKILLPIISVSKVSYKQKLTIKNQFENFAKSILSFVY